MSKGQGYAVKSGIILIIISFILSLLLGVTGITQSVTHSNNEIQIFIIFLLPGLLLMLPIMLSEVMPAWIGTPSVIIISLVAWFLIGALIGWIFGKIKSRINKDN